MFWFVTGLCFVSFEIVVFHERAVGTSALRWGGAELQIALLEYFEVLLKNYVYLPQKSSL